MKLITRKVFAVLAAITVSVSLPMSAGADEVGPAEDINPVEEAETEAVEASDLIQGATYLKEGTNGLMQAVLLCSGTQSMLMCFGDETEGLLGKAWDAGVRNLDYLILAAGDGQGGIFTDIPEGISIGAVYSAGNQTVLDSASQAGVETGCPGFFYLGNECVLLYPCDDGSLGALVYNPDCAVFFADAMTDMSVLEGHNETGLIDILSISQRSGTEAGILSLMYPENVIINGSVPDDSQLQALYVPWSEGASIFYRAQESTGFPMSFMTSPQAAQQMYLTIKNPVDEPLADVNETDQIQQSGAVIEIESVAMEVINGKWGKGMERWNALAEAGYDPYEVQVLVEAFMAGDNHDLDEFIRDSYSEKTPEQLSHEVCAGLWGQTQEQQWKALEEAGYDPYDILVLAYGGAK